MLFAVASPAAAFEAARDNRAGEIGVSFGVLLPDSDVSGRSSSASNLEPQIGFRGDYLFHAHYGWFVDALFQSYDEDFTGGDVDSYVIRSGVEFFHAPHWTWYQTFLTVGLGWIAVDQDNLERFDRPLFSLGLGQRFALGEKTWLRWELRGDYTLGNEGVLGEDVVQGNALMAITWGGMRRRPDSDSDGVSDRRDKCPGTPIGAAVNDDGCPLDGDGDGVYDGLDRCPDTPTGWPVDETGCSLDSDGDGVPDGIDRCPDTPTGAIVDARGCPLDSDGDGVYDGIDQCPGTPAGAVVDERGCPVDSDGDGVYDGIDQCPDTPRGTPVDEVGCPRAAPLFVEERKTLILEGVGFGFDSAELTGTSRAVLDTVADSLIDWPAIRVEIGGHTDGAGNAGYNRGLSESRARTVRDYLISRGVAPDRLAARGYGEDRPIADNATAAGREMNRRVELTAIE
jgi:OOP family OmpA-OmpF porin